jgi:Predicted transcriptional regulator
MTTKPMKGATVYLSKGDDMDDELFEETLESIEDLPTTTPMYTYILYAEGTRWIKVGHAIDVEARRLDLQVGCPPLLKVLWTTPSENAVALEELIKAYLAPYELQGEWFTLPDDIPTTLDLLAFVYKHSQPTLSFSGPLSRLQKLGIMEKRILEVLEAHEWLSVRGLMEVIGASDSQYRYVRKLLSSLVKRGLLAKFSYGKYCLPSKQLKEGLL